MNSTQIFIMVASVVLMLLPLMVILIMEEDKQHIEITKCYDRYGNEIIGLFCEEEVYNVPSVKYLIDFFSMTFMFGLIIFLGGGVSQMFETINKGSKK